MKKFKVTIAETLEKTVEVEAENMDEAEQMVNDAWYSGKHILDADCFKNVDFNVSQVVPEKIKVVMLEPNKVARVAEIGTKLEDLQSVVGGLIEPAYYLDDPDCCVIVNEEGNLSVRLKKLRRDILVCDRIEEQEPKIEEKIDKALGVNVRETDKHRKNRKYRS